MSACSGPRQFRAHALFREGQQGSWPRRAEAGLAGLPCRLLLLATTDCCKLPAPDLLPYVRIITFQQCFQLRAFFQPMECLIGRA